VLEAFNMDGSEFLSLLAAREVQPDHVLMNLPAIATTFLPALEPWRQKMRPRNEENSALCSKPVRVHCYCFADVGDAAATNEDTGTDGFLRDKDNSRDRSSTVGPTPHKHCAVAAKDAAVAGAVAVGQVEEALRVPLGSLRVGGHLNYTHLVRWVSPKRAMVCVGFDLPPLVSPS